MIVINEIVDVKVVLDEVLILYYDYIVLVGYL